MYHKRNKIISLFCPDLRRRYYLREISKLSNIPLKTASRILEELEKENIINSHYEGRHKYFELNLDDIRTKFIVQEAEIYRTFTFFEKYPIFKLFLKELKLIDDVLIVYGSFAEFTAGKDSDVDILIISNKKPSLPEYLLPHRIHKITLSKKEFLSALEKAEPLIKEVITNHIILHNHSFFIDVLWRYYEKRA